MKPLSEALTASEQTSPDYAVQSVVRACDILASFQTSEEVLQLRQVTEKTRLNKVTAFRLLSTLVSKGLLERVGKNGYRSKFQPLRTRRYRIGYAAQSTVIPYITTVTESLMSACGEAGVDLIVLNNKASRKIAVRNAAQLIREKVDLAIEMQIHADIAVTLSGMYADAHIPVITLDAPQPGAVYFGADNYKAGHIAGMHLGRWAAMNWQGQIDEVICLNEPAAGAILNARVLGALDGLHHVLPHSTNVPLSKYEIRPNFEYALTTIRKHLRRSKGRHILVIAINDPSALGTLQAFREFGREENCAIVGQGAVIEARHELRRPGTRLIGSVAYFPESYGERVIRIAVDILEKRAISKVTLVHHQIVHAQNVNKIYPNDLLMEFKSLGEA